MAPCTRRRVPRRSFHGSAPFLQCRHTSRRMHCHLTAAGPSPNSSHRCGPSRRFTLQVGSGSAASWRTLRGPSYMVSGQHKFRLFILAVSAIMKYGERSWKPWAASLGTELASYLCSSQFDILQALVAKAGGPIPSGEPLAPVDQEENRQRAYAFIYYLFREPFYEKFTKYVGYHPVLHRSVTLASRPRLEAFCEGPGKIPLLSLVAGAHTWVSQNCLILVQVWCGTISLWWSRHISIRRDPNTVRNR